MKKKLTPLKAIRLRCLDCCCQQTGEVRFCTVKDCSLWPYRFGKMPDEYPTYEVPDPTPEQIERGKRLADRRHRKET